MPNGKGGDHPLTDMLIHNLNSNFPDDVYRMIREMAAQPHFDRIREQIATLLSENWPRLSNVEPDMDHIRTELNRLQNEI